MRGFRSILILITSFSFIFICSVFEAQCQDGASLPRRSQYKKIIVKEVRFSGVRSFSVSEIRGLLLTKPNRWFNIVKKRKLSRSNVAADINTIERFYERRGYLFADVGDSVIFRNGDEAVVLFKVDEGVRTYLSGIGVEGGIPVLNRKLDKTLKNFKPGEPLNGIMVRSAGFVLRDIYRDFGYPYTQINRKYEFTGDTSSVNVIYAVAESVYTVNGDISLEREGYTHPGVVKRELIVKRGKMYSEKDIIESEQRLYSTGLFKIINLRKADSTAVISNDTCRVDLNLSYVERKSYFVNAGVGIGREEDFEVVLRSSIRFGDRNVFGTGRKIFVGVRPLYQLTDFEGPVESFSFSTLDRKIAFRSIRTTWELNYVEPWPFNLRIPTSLGFTYEPNTLNPVFGYRYNRIAGELSLLRELDRFTTTRVNIRTEYIDIKNVPEDQEEAFRQEGDNQIRRKISLYGDRDTRDNLFVPQRGSYSYAGIDYVGDILGGDFNYLKAQFSWSRYQILTGQNIIATRLWFGWLDDLGKEGRSSVEDRFLLGGATTIRGYAENTLGPVFTEADDPGDKLGKPKGGRYMMVGNLEIRRPLFWRFGGAAFVDAGNTYSRLADITPLSVAFSSGMGLQFFTPIGPLRLDYAVRLKKEFDLSAGNIHLSILYGF
ncbi:MAG: BamA/TamA family outer membrane protein [Candidatus Zixiibacteriota bacterium]|nr:MAG: BamA/TamA family outer membrane protein [candidate division Zixibacteria bacterium]